MLLLVRITERLMRLLALDASFVLVDAEAMIGRC